MPPKYAECGLECYDPITMNNREKDKIYDVYFSNKVLRKKYF